MFKKLLTSMIAASLALSAATPAIAGVLDDRSAEEFRTTLSAECYATKHTGGINKTELTCYDKAWIDYWRADDNSGRLGNIVWLRVGDELVTLTAKEIRNGGDKVIEKKIVSSLIAQELESLKAEHLKTEAEIESVITIAELLGINTEGKTIVEIVHEMNTLAASNGSAASIEQAAAYLNAKTYVTAYVDEDGNLVVNLQAFWDRIDELKSNIERLENIDVEAEFEIQDAVKGGEINVGFSSVITGAINGPFAHLAPEGMTIEYIIIGDGTPDGLTAYRYENGAITEVALEDVTGYTLTLSIDGAGVYAGSMNTYENGNFVGFDNFVPLNNKFLTYSDNIFVTEFVNGQEAGILINGHLIEFNVDMSIEEFQAAIKEAYTIGYNDGYKDGYKDGYEDGYAAGFADGVASVS